MVDNEHKPVMIKEVIQYLSPQDHEVYVDCTFGRGGYSREILSSCNCKVIAFDRDPDAQEKAQELRMEFPESFDFVETKFSHISQALQSLGVSRVDGIVADFGVSSPQLDNPEKGFSFMREGPLDMQMGGDTLTAYDVINRFGEKDLADIFWKYGEERFSRRIAKAIVFNRTDKEICTTLQLADLITQTIGKREKIHPATRVFQALRIYVNQELDEIISLLNQSLSLLKDKGRIVCVSFHSLEDRIIKTFFAQNSEKHKKINKYGTQKPLYEKELMVLTNKPCVPHAGEILNNVRARSAKLRAALRTSIHITPLVFMIVAGLNKLCLSARFV